jgi:hypothetical protein
MNFDIFLQRELEKISQKIVIQKRAERMFAESGKILSHSTDLPEGATSYTFPIMNMEGRAAIITNSSFDVGGVEALIEERTRRVHVAWQPFSILFTQEINARYAGRNISAVAMEVAAQSMYNLVDEIGYEGLAARGYDSLANPGLLNQPNALLYTLPADGTAGSTTLASKSPEQVLRDLSGIAYHSAKITDHAYVGKILLVPKSVYETITTRIFGNSTSQTIYTVFLQNQQIQGGLGIDQIIPMPKLDTLGPGGTPMIVCYNPRPDYIEYLKTPGISRRPWFPDLTGTRSAYYGYNAGVLLRQSLSLTYAYGA